MKKGFSVSLRPLRDLDFQFVVERLLRLGATCACTFKNRRCGCCERHGRGQGREGTGRQVYRQFDTHRQAVRQAGGARRGFLLTANP